MARLSKFSSSPLALVRRYFGLDQQQLATYLGIGAAMVGHLEAGRRAVSSAVLLRLAPLAARLPPDAAVPFDQTTLPAGMAPPDPTPLLARLDYCRHHARRLRRQLRHLARPAAHAHRWQQALPRLLAAPPDPQEPERAAHVRAWLLRRQEQAAAALDGTASARHHLLRLQAEALETEAAALAALLPAPADAPPNPDANQAAP